MTNNSQNVGNIVMCGLGFFTFYFSYNVIQNFLTEIFEQLGFSQLGFYILAVICITICVFSLIIGPLPTLLGPGKLMAAAGICISLFAACFLLPVYCHYFSSSDGVCSHGFITSAFMILSVIAGFSFSALWVGQGTYLQQCAVSGNADTLQGIFWFFLQWSQISGNFCAALLLTSQFAQVVFFTVLVGFAVSSVFIFAFLPRPDAAPQKSVAVAAPMEVGDLFANTLDSIKSTFRLFFSRRMVSLCPYIIYAGMIGAYFCGVVPILAEDAMRKVGITDKILVNKETAKIMIFFGIADSVGGYVFGKLTHSLGKRIGMLIVLVVGLVSMLYTYIVCYYVPYGFAWLFVEFFMGLCDGSVNPIVMALLASDFKETSEPFCVFMFIKNFVCFAIFLIGAWLRNSPPCILMSAVVACCLAGYVGSMFFPYKEEDRDTDSARELADVTTSYHEVV